MVVFGPNILIILGGSKRSGTHISENHLGISFALFYWTGMGPNGSNRPIFKMKNCIARIGKKSPPNDKTR